LVLLEEEEDDEGGAMEFCTVTGLLFGLSFSAFGRLEGGIGVASREAF